jgi:hypothetical protein
MNAQGLEETAGKRNRAVSNSSCIFSSSLHYLEIGYNLIDNRSYEAGFLAAIKGS